MFPLSDYFELGKRKRNGSVRGCVTSGFLSWWLRCRLPAGWTRTVTAFISIRNASAANQPPLFYLLTYLFIPEFSFLFQLLWHRSQFHLISSPSVISVRILSMILPRFLTILSVSWQSAVEFNENETVRCDGNQLNRLQSIQLRSKHLKMTWKYRDIGENIAVDSSLEAKVDVK